MNRRRFWAGPLALGVGILVGFGFVPSDGWTQSPKELRLCHNSNNDSATDKAAHKFAEIVANKTRNQVKILIYPRNQLGGNRELIEQVKMGSLDMTLMGLAVLGYLVDEYNFMQIPFAFRSQEHIYKVLDSDIGQTIAKKLQERGFLLLNQKWDRLPRHIAGKKPIQTLQDLKGYRIRTGTPAFQEGIKVFGAAPIKIELNEMFIALQQGVVEGVELPLDYIYDYSIHEVAKFLSLTYHTYGTQFVGIHRKTFESLSPENQKALIEAAAEAGEINNTLTWSQEEDYIKKLEKAGVKVVKPEHSQFVKVLEANVASLEKKWPACKGLFARIQAIQ